MPLLLTSLGPGLTAYGSEISFSVAVTLLRLLEVLSDRKEKSLASVAGQLLVHPKTVRRAVDEARGMDLKFSISGKSIGLKALPEPFFSRAITQDERTMLEHLLQTYRECKGPSYASVVDELMVALGALKTSIGNAPSESEPHLKQDPESKVLRLLHLEICLHRSSATPKRKGMANRFGRVVRTVDRDLDSARNQLGWPVGGRPSGGVYARQPLSASSPRGFLTAYHRLVLADEVLPRMALHLGLEPAYLTHWRARVVGLSQVPRNWDPPGAPRLELGRSPAAVSGSWKVWRETISHALLSGQLLRIKYSDRWITSHVAVKPLALVSDSEGWELRAWSIPLRKQIRVPFQGIQDLDLMPDGIDEISLAE